MGRKVAEIDPQNIVREGKGQMGILKLANLICVSLGCRLPRGNMLLFVFAVCVCPHPGSGWLYPMLVWYWEEELKRPATGRSRWPQ